MDASRDSCFYGTDPARAEASLSAHVSRHGLLSGVRRLGLAVSGGADSVALFHLMLPVCQAAGIAVTVVHLDHGLRAEAEDDARFVLELAGRAGIAVLCEKISVPGLRQSGASLEMAARAARLAFLKRCSVSAGLDAIATGHQADDVAETLLLRLARGAGGTGLSGLRPRSKQPGLTLIRPLLSLSGAALRAWLRQNSHPWREDASNRDCAIPRNRVRNDVLPHLEAAWRPDLRARLCQSAEALREDDALLDMQAAERLADIAVGESLPVAALCRHAAALQRRILRHWLFQRKLAEAAGLETTLALLAQCHKPGNWKQQLPGGQHAVCDAGFLFIGPVDTALPEAAEVEGGLVLAWGDLAIHAEPDRGVCSIADGIGVYPAVCSLDAARLKGQRLTVRSRQPGDRISPTGLEGSKKIQDLFVDAKVPEHQRARLPLFVCGHEVIWLPGYRISRHYAVPAPDAPSVRITVEQGRR